MSFGSGSGRVADDLELRELGHALWRRRWHILGATVITALLAFIVVNLYTPEYRSEARVLIETHGNIYLRPEADKNVTPSVVDQEAVASQVQVILSRDLARQVIQKLKLGELPEFDPVLKGVSFPKVLLSLVGLARDPLQMAPEERVLDAYYARLNVSEVDSSRVISVSFESHNPELAARVANAVADTYLEMQRAAQQEQARSAGQWLAGEIENMRRKVADAEAKVEQFRSKSNLFVGPNNTSLAAQQLSEVNTQIATARGQKADAESKAQMIRDMLRAGKPLEASDVLNSELIRRLIEQRATLKAQLSEQSATLLPFHPRIKELRAQIAEMDAQIRAEAQRIVRSLESNARVADGRVNALTVSLEQLKQLASSSIGSDVQLRALEREAKAQRDLLESYLARYREATARDSLQAAPSDARVISRAAVSNTPAFPKKLPIIFLVALTTLVLGAGFVATGALLSGTPYLVAVPAPKPSLLPSLRGAASAPSPRVESDIMPPAAARPPAGLPTRSIDAVVRDLRDAGEGGRRITIVGAARNVGTTHTAIMLGRALAKDKRTVLLDLALSAPNVSVISNHPEAPGIAELVRGEASFGDIITRDRFSRLHLIAVGNADSHGPAIIVSQRLAATLDALTRTYDHVVVDAGALPEAAIECLAQLAPRALLVATNITNPATTAARDKLLAAGFTDVALLLGQPGEAAAA
jgi:tyrosine-protein kinase Etk/Wzc